MQELLEGQAVGRLLLQRLAAGATGVKQARSVYTYISCIQEFCRGLCTLVLFILYCNEDGPVVESSDQQQSWLCGETSLRERPIGSGIIDVVPTIASSHSFWSKNLLGAVEPLVQFHR